MSFNKESNLSVRSKRRRIQEELQNSRNDVYSFNKSQTSRLHSLMMNILNQTLMFVLTHQYPNQYLIK